MATTETAGTEPLIQNDDRTNSSSNPPLDLNVRKTRLSFWCIIFWIVALADLAANSLALHAEEDAPHSDLKTAQRLWLTADVLILVGIIMAVVHLYYVTEENMIKIVSAVLFIIGGVLRIAGTSQYVDSYCADTFVSDKNWCTVLWFGGDFMFEYLTIFVGIDILVMDLNERILRLIGYNGILSVCCLLLASYASHVAGQNEFNDTEQSRTTQSAFYIVGGVCAILFIVLLVIKVTGHSMEHNDTTKNIHLVLGLILMVGAGLVHYSGANLLVISTTVIIAYELQYM